MLSLCSLPLSSRLITLLSCDSQLENSCYKDIAVDRLLQGDFREAVKGELTAERLPNVKGYKQQRQQAGRILEK